VTKVTVTTADGYILNLFRVTGSPNFPENGTVKPAIYVNHGLGGSSNMFLIQEGKNNLSKFIIGGKLITKLKNISRNIIDLVTQLADNGYDVWIGNCRGNSYSNKHVNLTASQLAYWDFS